MKSQTLQPANIVILCALDKDPRSLACEHKQRAEWVHVSAATDTIKVSCGNFTVTFICKDGEDDTRQYTMRNVLVALGFYAHTLDVPDKIVDKSKARMSYLVEWPRIVNVARGARDYHSPDRSQGPIVTPILT